MKYMGSKRRIAKEILPIILKYRKPGQYYVEPFVGGANMIDKVDGNRIAADINNYLIALLKYTADGNAKYLPKKLSEWEYNQIKNNKDEYPKYIVGYVGFLCSYGAKWFGGYCRDKEGKRNYILEAYNNVNKSKIEGIHFLNRSYHNLNIPPNSIIYCDPPYQGTTKYRDPFDHDAFWAWCRIMSNRGHYVFISEYNAPKDFICLWSKEINSSLTKETGSKKGIEKLFTYI